MTYDNVPQHDEWQEFRVGQGILVEGGKVLLAANRWYTDRPLVWTLPGGRAANGEGMAEAAVREFHEETGVVVSIERLAFVAEARSLQSRRLFLTCGFTMRRLSGELTCTGDASVEELRFVPYDDLHLYLISPSLHDPLSWHLRNPDHPVRYWFFPEYQA